MNVGDHLSLTIAGGDGGNFIVMKRVPRPADENNWYGRAATNLPPLNSTLFRETMMPTMKTKRRNPYLRALAISLLVVASACVVLSTIAWGQNGSISFCHNAVRLFPGGKVTFDWPAIRSYANDPNEQVCVIAWAAKNS